MKHLILALLILAGTGSSVFPQQFEEYESKQVLRGPAGVQNIRFSPDGKYLGGALQNGSVIIWEVASGRVHKTLYGHRQGVNEVSFSRDGRMIASAGADGQAIVWEVASGRKLSTHQSKPYAFTNGQEYKSASFVSFTADGNYIYFAGDPGNIMKARVGSSEPAAAVFSTNYQDGRWYSTVTGGCVTEDGRYLVFSVGKLIEYLDVKTDRLSHYIKDEENLNDVTDGPFPNSAAVWSYDGRVTFWNNNTKAKISSYTVTTPNNYSAATFSKDKRYMATGASGNEAKIWDLTNGRLVQILRGHSQIVRLCRFSPTEDILATASYDGTARIWGHIKEEEPVVAQKDPIPPVEEPKPKVVVVHDTVKVVKTEKVVVYDTVRVTVRDTVVVHDETTKKIVFEDEEVAVGKSINLKNVQFQQSRDVILDPSFPELEKVVRLMRENPNMIIELGGHTDNVGNAAANVSLSRKRVIKVKKFLTDKGIHPDRIETKAYGGSKPIADNRNEKGRKENRRVEFTIIKM